MQKLTVAFFERWQHRDGLARIEQASEVDLRFMRFDAPEPEIKATLGQIHGYQIGASRDEVPLWLHGTADFIGLCPNLLAVVSNGAGYDTVDVDACSSAGVLVFNQAGGNREAVAEHALGMMLALTKRFVETDRAMRRDRTWHRNDFLGRDLYGRTLGIIGLGHVGSRVAELCRGLFNMTVLAHDPYVDDARFEELGVQRADFDDLLRRSDFVSLHTPRTAETTRMMDARAYGLMQPHAYFVTTARGGIHDEAALTDALREGRIAGAGLDVWDAEPPPLDHPLLQFDTVIVTPHTAGVTDDARRTVAMGAVDQWVDLAHGRKPPRLLNPEAWPKFAERYQQTLGARPAA